MTHCFAVCAYKDSPYLRECMESLRLQEHPSPLLLCTATPSPYLENMAREYGATYCVNPHAPGIGSDWNFAMEQAKATGYDLVTLCHQDDLYLPGYGAAVQAMASPDMLIYFSGYGEKRGEEVVTSSRLLRIKRLLLWRMRIRPFQRSRLMKHRTLALGDPICCPSVTFHLCRLPLPLFQTDMTTSLDWQAWERISRMDGRFVYDPAVRMLHRIHTNSTTPQVLEKGGRQPEDYAMFRKFWCTPIARLLTKWYSASEKSNQL